MSEGKLSVANVALVLQFFEVPLEDGVAGTRPIFGRRIVKGSVFEPLGRGEVATYLTQFRFSVRSDEHWDVSANTSGEDFPQLRAHCSGRVESGGHTCYSI